MQHITHKYVSFYYMQITANNIDMHIVLIRYETYSINKTPDKRASVTNTRGNMHNSSQSV